MSNQCTVFLEAPAFLDSLLKHLQDTVIWLCIVDLNQDLRDLNPQVPHDSRQLKFMKYGLFEQCPNLDH